MESIYTYTCSTGNKVGDEVEEVLNSTNELDFDT